MRERFTNTHHHEIPNAQRCVRLAEYLIEHQATVRATARYFGISKSTVHKDISEKLPHINSALYEEAHRILALNKAQRHIRGGEATKNKYQRIRERRRTMQNVIDTAGN